jgi:hypothetical protein
VTSLKDPENEAENPAPMPRSQQGRGGASHVSDPEGRQGGTIKKARMAPLPCAPPGLEQDSHGNAIPFEERTEEDQEKARGV